MRRHLLDDQVHVIHGGQTEESGARAAQSVLRSEPHPTAVLTFNDRSAMGLVDTMIRAGIDVPEEISVIGYDDSPIARLAHINLTQSARLARARWPSTPGPGKRETLEVEGRADVFSRVTDFVYAPREPTVSVT